jgi:D-3-phosphoglycerate dehydrogenase / 2-oxoglutarate reductase
MRSEADSVEILLLDLLEWIGPSRPYFEVLDAWRTSCPRFPIWEEANDRGFIHRHRDGTEVLISVTEAGSDYLLRSRRNQADGRPVP